MPYTRGVNVSFLLSLCLLVAPGCRHVTASLVDKTITPEVVQAASKPDSWFSYLPEYAPGFCLKTERALIWREPGMRLGSWRGLEPHPPYRVMMEARGDTFVLHRSYVWDGMTVGETRLRDLAPTVRHDALYHALKEGATFRRSEADRALRRDMLRFGGSVAGLDYAIIRTFGRFFLRPDAEKTMIVVSVDPKEPFAPLEAPDEREKAARNPLPSAISPALPPR